MMIAVRLDRELEKNLAAAAREEGVTKSDVIRASLKEYLARKKSPGTPWELGKDVFGKFGSGRSDLSTVRKRILREKINARKGRHRLRSSGRSV